MDLLLFFLSHVHTEKFRGLHVHIFDQPFVKVVVHGQVCEPISSTLSVESVKNTCLGEPSVSWAQAHILKHFWAQTSTCGKAVSRVHGYSFKSGGCGMWKPEMLVEYFLGLNSSSSQGLHIHIGDGFGRGCESFHGLRNEPMSSSTRLLHHFWGTQLFYGLLIFLWKDRLWKFRESGNTTEVLLIIY